MLSKKTSHTLLAILILQLGLAQLFASPPILISTQTNPRTITVSYTPAHPANVFIPAESLGAGIDGHEKGEINRMLTPRNISQMLAAGFQPLTYRLRTELAGDAWHWNPQGRWSDQKRRQGYWISSDQSKTPIALCYGYRLSRRGSTTDQANNDGYSRIADGDVNSFWKSNPYLDSHFTGEDDALHPQWVVIDLGETRPVNAIRLLWGTPFATHYIVEYGNQDAMPEVAFVKAGHRNIWTRFPRGEVERGVGGEAFIQLGDAPIATRFVRVWMTQSSHVAPRNSKDARDRAGYALREIYVGLLNQAGRFHDYLKHAKAHDRQTVIATSSTDPFHKASSMDKGVEQIGFDRLFRSGLAKGKPVLMPVAMLYDTPENAVAEIGYLQSQGYPIAGIEMGEEPEGQYITPEDYGALYLEWADALHRVAPKLQLGGPGLAAIDLDMQVPPDDPDTRLWMKRFIDYLRARHRLKELAFFSFEWYPFDEVCESAAVHLVEAPQLLANALARMREAGVPQDIPWMITEYGYSAFAARAEVDIEGALFNAESVAQFLTLGGRRAYLFGYEPNEVIQEVPCTWGINAMFLLGEEGEIKYRLATYYAAWLLTEVWAQPANERLEIYPAKSDIVNQSGQPLVTAYALRRPNGEWALMLINKDPQEVWSVQIAFENEQTARRGAFKDSAELFQYSRQQYLWKEDGERGYPLRSLPPTRLTLPDAGKQSIALPPYSLSIIQGRMAEENNK